MSARRGMDEVVDDGVHVPAQGLDLHGVGIDEDAGGDAGTGKAADDVTQTAYVEALRRLPPVKGTELKICPEVLLSPAINWLRSRPT